MSFEAMAWAVKQSTANSGQKLVLLLLANHANGHTGQCNPSHRLLAIECSMGISTLKGHISALAQAGFVTIINKYQDGVQLPNQYNINMSGVTPNLAGVGSESGWGVGQNLATKQEDKPLIEPNTVISNKNSMFEQFWTAYPRKTNKGFARTVFGRIKPNPGMLKKMIVAIEQQKSSDQWKDPKYIPHPSTWLNGERWEDEATGKPSFNPFAGAI